MIRKELPSASVIVVAPVLWSTQPVSGLYPELLIGAKLSVALP
jgi:hypothetical protein